jgi:hypothetical protein
LVAVQQLVPQLTAPALQVTVQVPATHCAVALGGGGGQGEQVGPQFETLSATHCPEQRLWPGLQLMPHVPAVQVAVPFATVGQGVHELPQLLGLVSETQ